MRCHEILQRTLKRVAKNSKASHLVAEHQIEITCIEREDDRHLLGRTGKEVLDVSKDGETPFVDNS
eukprot:scaffold33600_cov98-Skeletonema_dohrnii-CCMP3373.AAC.2